MTENSFNNSLKEGFSLWSSEWLWWLSSAECWPCSVCGWQQVGAVVWADRNWGCVCWGSPLLTPGRLEGAVWEGQRCCRSLSGRMTPFPGINTLLGQAASAKELCDVAAGWVLPFWAVPWAQAHPLVWTVKVSISRWMCRNVADRGFDSFKVCVYALIMQLK